MKKLSSIAAATFLLSIAPASAQEKGYVLKAGEGEKLGPNRTIKASPESGTQGGVMVLDYLEPGFSTGRHRHTSADEFFYVIRGTGTATLESGETLIEPGDVVFVPAGAEHKMAVTGTEPMELLYFLDEPGLDGFFREIHAEFISRSEPLTLEDCNTVGAKYGMVCITTE